MQQSRSFLETPPGRQPHAFAELEVLRATVVQMRDDLLDFNPLLAVMADGLQRALELEIEARRCNQQHGDRV